VYGLSSRLVSEGTRTRTGSLTASWPAGTVRDVALRKEIERVVAAAELGFFGAVASCAATAVESIYCGAVLPVGVNRGPHAECEVRNANGRQPRYIG
jgi:hypothetical protein